MTAGTDDVAGAPVPQPRRVLRTILFASVPLLLLLLLLELTLWVAGIGDPAAQKSLGRGFDDGSSYLVPDPERPGGWVTQMMDQPRDELHVPPRDGRVRVLLFGGSNTYLMPEEELQDLLDQAAPDPGHEVLNLGRPGYGSGRALVLLRQALERLGPDVVVIYAGHNEFVEGSFAAELADTWGSSWSRGIAGLAQQFRTVNLLTSLVRDMAKPREAARRPDGVAQREANFDLHYDKTLEFYDAYRRNLEAMCEAAREAGVGMVISTVVGNDLNQPVVAHHAPTRTKEEIQEFNRALGKANALVPKRLVTGMFWLDPEHPVIRLRWMHWGEHIMPGDPRGGKGGDRQPPPLRQLLPPLGAEPLWLDPANWEPLTFDVLDTVSAFHARDLTEDERASLAKAENQVEKAVAISPEYAVAVFEQGLFRYLQGDAPGALALLRRAATLDCVPNRGNDITNGIVREVAAAHPEVLFIDAETLFRARTPDGLVGYELVMDNCHLHPGARSLLMADFVPPIRELATRR